MILVGNRRGSPAELARHIMNMVENDHVHIHEMRGFIADNLDGAFHEAYAISRGTRCRKFLYSLSLSPPQTENVPVNVFEAAIGKIEHRLGFVGQPRSIIFHEKKGRRHAHVVWSRIDAGTMRAIDPYQDKLTLESIARELFLEHGWNMPLGLKRKTDTDLLNYSHAQAGQAKRAKRDPKELKRLFSRCWQQSDSGGSFASALREQGFILARGDRRGFVAVDAGGEVYSISRWAGVKTKELRARFGNCDDLPCVDDALRQFGEGENHTPDQEAKNRQLRYALEHLEQKQLALVTAHREARLELEQRQQTRRVIEIKSRNEKIPAGLRAAWFKLSGRYQGILKEIEADATRAQRRDRDEYQVLVESQLIERRALQGDMDRLRRKLSDKDDQPDFVLRLLESDPAQALVIPPDPEILSIREKVQNNPAHILEVITGKREEFSRPDIVRALAEHIDDPLTLGHAVDNVMRSPDLVETASKPLPRYSTKWMLAVKAALSDRVSELSAANGYAVSTRHIDAAIDAQNRELESAFGGRLSSQQENTIRHCLGQDRIAAVVGLAGAGKSTMLSAVREAYERQGLRVRGAALSGKAADGLESSSGIESRTLASIERSWEKGFETLTHGDVLVIDEAGMIGTRQLHRFVDHVAKTGAKIILVGDPEQLQPINAGTPFKEITDQISAAHLTEIHRQNKDWQKQASLDFAEARTGKAIDTYEAHGNVKQARDPETAIVNLINDYMADLLLNGNEASRLALAYRRKDVHAINQAIRAARKSSGDLTGEIMLQTDHGKRAFAQGDRIILTKPEYTLGLRNGMFGTVKTVNEDKMAIVLDSGDGQEGRSITINPNLYRSFDHGYATTIHKSQGATIDRSYVLGSTLMDRHLTYVAMTRHGHDVRLYGDKNAIQKMRRCRVEDIANSQPESPHTRRHRRGPMAH